AFVYARRRPACSAGTSQRRVHGSIRQRAASDRSGLKGAKNLAASQSVLVNDRSVPLLGSSESCHVSSVGAVDCRAVVDAFLLRMLLAALIGWLDRRQQETVAYLVEENRVLRKQLQAGVSGSAMTRGVGSPFVGTKWADACCARSRRSSRLTRSSDGIDS